MILIDKNLNNNFKYVYYLCILEEEVLHINLPCCYSALFLFFYGSNVTKKKKQFYFMGFYTCTRYQVCPDDYFQFFLTQVHIF